MTAVTSDSIKGAHHEQWVQASTLPPGVFFQSITRFIVMGRTLTVETCWTLRALLIADRREANASLDARGPVAIHTRPGHCDGFLARRAFRFRSKFFGTSRCPYPRRPPRASLWRCPEFRRTLRRSLTRLQTDQRTFLPAEARGPALDIHHHRNAGPVRKRNSGYRFPKLNFNTSINLDLDHRCLHAGHLRFLRSGIFSEDHVMAHFALAARSELSFRPPWLIPRSLREAHQW